MKYMNVYHCPKCNHKFAVEKEIAPLVCPSCRVEFSTKNVPIIVSQIGFR